MNFNNILFKFSDNDMSNLKLIKEFDINIINMKIDNYKNNIIYDAIINVKEDNLKNIYKYLKISGIEYYKTIGR